MNRFNRKRSNVTLFLNLFERSADRSGFETSDFVRHLLALLHIGIVELILHEPTDRIDNFEHVKSILLARYRLSHEAYRQNFTKHASNPQSPWKDFIFEINSYLESWLNDIEIRQLFDMKDLLITDQTKRRALAELNDDFIDSWVNYKDPFVLPTNLDEYEAIKGVPKNR